MTTPLTFGSLFAGIGGFELGFERAGMVCKWQVEIDDYATRVLAKHWPHVHRERDIRECGRMVLQRVDVVCGGFPCQDISYAGHMAGLDGERSGLFFEAVRVVRELRPDIVVLENVAALLTGGLDRVLGSMAQIGYDSEWHCIPAAAFGAPHIRDRVFVIAYSERYGWHERGRVEKDQKEARKRRSKSSGGCQILADSTSIGSRAFRQMLDWTQRADRSGRGGKLGASEQWVTEPDVGRVAHGVSARVDRLRGLGNAVVPQVAEWIGRRIVEAIKQ